MRWGRAAVLAAAVIMTALLASRLLPWRPLSPLPGSDLSASASVLFVAAHHDDELVRLVRMRRLVEAGQSVHIAWLASDHYQTSLEVGRSESRCAARLVGIPDQNLHFLPDDQLYAPGSMLDDLVPLALYLEGIVDEVEPEALFVNAYEGGHLEHDAAHVVSVLAASRVQRSIPIYEFPFYNAAGSRWPYYQVMTLVEAPGASHSDYPSSAELAMLLRAARCFDTQAAHIWAALAAANLRLLSKGIPFRKISGYDYTRPPHPGRLNYEGLEWYLTLTQALPFVGEVFARPDGVEFGGFAQAVSDASRRLRE